MNNTASNVVGTTATTNRPAPPPSSSSDDSTAASPHNVFALLVPALAVTWIVMSFSVGALVNAAARLQRTLAESTQDAADEAFRRFVEYCAAAALFRDEEESTTTTVVDGVVMTQPPAPSSFADVFNNVNNHGDINTQAEAYAAIRGIWTNVWTAWFVIAVLLSYRFAVPTKIVNAVLALVRGIANVFIVWPVSFLSNTVVWLLLGEGDGDGEGTRSGTWKKRNRRKHQRRRRSASAASSSRYYFVRDDDDSEYDSEASGDDEEYAAALAASVSVGNTQTFNTTKTKMNTKLYRAGNVVGKPVPFTSGGGAAKKNNKTSATTNRGGGNAAANANRRNNVGSKRPRTSTACTATATAPGVVVGKPVPYTSEGARKAAELLKAKAKASKKKRS